MQVTTKALVLSSLKYGDTSLIVRAFTLSDGPKGYLLKGVLTSRKGKLRPALFQPLTQLELVAQHRNKGTLESIKEAKVLYHYQTLHSDIVKNSIVLFLAEMLSITLQEGDADPNLYAFLEYALHWLDHHEHTAHFPIFFLLQLTQYLGFFPDISNKELPYFDLQEACFVNTPTLNPMLEGNVLHTFKLFLGINFDDLKSIETNKQHRQELLQKVLLYFELHLHGYRKPKSLAVLNTVFG
ncbi:MAG: DNA repair protein RecO [Bacteroidota bacterium]